MGKLLCLLLFLLPVTLIAQHIDSTPLFNQINAYRQSKGIKPLVYDSVLHFQVRAWVERIPMRFRHEEVDCIENIVRCANHESIISIWAGSTWHNKNMLNPEIGLGAVAVYKKFGTYYAVFRAK
jgi:uncharacterized protein YkwD